MQDTEERSREGTALGLEKIVDEIKGQNTEK